MGGRNFALAFAILGALACEPASNVPCGAGTHPTPNGCEADPPCGAGTRAVNGTCVADFSCGTGTHEAQGTCVPNDVATPSEYEVRVVSPSVSADGVSKVPVRVVKRGGGDDGETITLSLSRSTAGALFETEVKLDSFGATTWLTPCADGTPSCVGPFTISAARASAPNVTLARSVPLEMTTPSGLGSDAPCRGRGNALFLEGEPSQSIFRGVELFRGGHFTIKTLTSGDPVIYVDSHMEWGQWEVWFQAPEPFVTHKVYATPGLHDLVSGMGVGCGGAKGSFEITELVMAGGSVKSITATFVQDCLGKVRGCVHAEQ